MGSRWATGSGKTMVMALAVAWSYLNAVNEPECADYATSFLIMAPNVIVFERLQSDFAGGTIFWQYPMIPPEYLSQWSGMRFFMRGDRADMAADGAVYVTNIQQLYDVQHRGNRRSGGTPSSIAALLGPAASDSPG